MPGAFYQPTAADEAKRPKGARPEQSMEAVWVAADMRAGGAYAHSALAMSAIERSHSKKQEEN